MLKRKGARLASDGVIRKESAARLAAGRSALITPALLYLSYL